MLQKESKKIKKHSNYINSNHLNYFFKKYDFDELAIFHPPLSKYVHFSQQGVSTIDWKDPLALKELTKAILLHKFRINYWDIPRNFLCPTIPSRLNYLEWIFELLNTHKPTNLKQNQKPQNIKNINLESKDIKLSENHNKNQTNLNLEKSTLPSENITPFEIFNKKRTNIPHLQITNQRSDNLKNSAIVNHTTIKGLDIGAGASLIYPLLGFKRFGWRFTATEINPEAYKNALEIIEKNSFQNDIEIRFSQGGIFKGIINEKYDFFHFTMCNPPFFESLEEQKTVEWRKSELNEYEGEYKGGEVAFIKQMFNESKEYEKNVGIFTSLVGRKRDFEEIEKILIEAKNREKGLKIYSKTFYIGKNVRWAIAWKFM